MLRDIDLDPPVPIVVRRRTVRKWLVILYVFVASKGVKPLALQTLLIWLMIGCDGAAKMRVSVGEKVEVFGEPGVVVVDVWGKCSSSSDSWTMSRHRLGCVRWRMSEKNRRVWIV